MRKQTTVGLFVGGVIKHKQYSKLSLVKDGTFMQMHIYRGERISNFLYNNYIHF